MRTGLLACLVFVSSGAALTGSAMAANDWTDFCVRYSGHASSEATVAEQNSCGFNGPRWTTDRTAHMNACMSGFANAGGAADKEVATRDFFNGEDAARVAGIQECNARNAAKPAGGGGGGQTARVNADVDLYKSPGGEGSPIGMLEAGTMVGFLGCQGDNWCHVDQGWVWGDFLDKP